MTQLTDVLGAPYHAETIHLGSDDEGSVVATLVRRNADAPTGRAVLHLHGFCDYFFQTGLADFYTSEGYDFYALDLRKHGRSLLPHQTPNFCRDLREYFPEVDAALQRIRVRDAHHAVVLDAHSTGGLIGALWADEHRSSGVALVDALVLNSPWLDLRGSLLLRTAGTRAIDQVGLRRPYQVLPRTVARAYGESLHVDHRGEWTFDLNWKPVASFPIRAGWLRAVRRGHQRLHRGLDVGAPALVLCSSRSSAAQQWDDDCACTDTVLDVGQIARWAHALGPQVTIARIEGALHDVLCSAKPVRDGAYAQIRRWLGTYLVSAGDD
ncbi:MAG: alpha/beta hydrolase [Actinomycetota bacterium]|nr:alpha/beta hydrolase [Actinomycetota bacterium]